MKKQILYISILILILSSLVLVENLTTYNLDLSPIDVGDKLMAESNNFIIVLIIIVFLAMLCLMIFIFLQLLRT